MVSQCSRSRQIWLIYVRVNASLGKSASTTAAADAAFFPSSWGSGELQPDPTSITSRSSLSGYRMVLNLTKPSKPQKIIYNTGEPHKIKRGMEQYLKTRHLALWRTEPVSKNSIPEVAWYLRIPHSRASFNKNVTIIST